MGFTEYQIKMQFYYSLKLFYLISYQPKRDLARLGLI